MSHMADAVLAGRQTVVAKNEGVDKPAADAPKPAADAPKPAADAPKTAPEAEAIPDKDAEVEASA